MRDELSEALKKIITCNNGKQEQLQERVKAIELSNDLKEFIVTAVTLSDGAHSGGFSNGLSDQQDQSNQRLLKGEFSGYLVS